MQFKSFNFIQVGQFKITHYYIYYNLFVGIKQKRIFDVTMNNLLREDTNTQI